MAYDPVMNKKLSKLLTEITDLTTKGDLQWERELHSAHRFARWNNNLLILGPDASPDQRGISRYLFITPFDSPQHIEINSDNQALGPAVLALAGAVEAATANKKPIDPFALSQDLLKHLTK